MNAPLRVETITDVPAEQLQAMVDDYVKTGATVKVESTQGGKFTIRAEYTSESFYPASGISSVS